MSCPWRYCSLSGKVQVIRIVNEHNADVYANSASEVLSNPPVVID
jgi:hypothetical protein